MRPNLVQGWLPAEKAYSLGVVCGLETFKGMIYSVVTFDGMIACFMLGSLGLTAVIPTVLSATTAAVVLPLGIPISVVLSPFPLAMLYSGIIYVLWFNAMLCYAFIGVCDCRAYMFYST